MNNINALTLSTAIQFGYELARQSKLKSGCTQGTEPRFELWVKEFDGNGWAVTIVDEAHPKFGFHGGRNKEGPPPKGSFILQVTEV